MLVTCGYSHRDFSQLVCRDLKQVRAASIHLSLSRVERVLEDDHSAGTDRLVEFLSSVTIIDKPAK